MGMGGERMYQRAPIGVPDFDGLVMRGSIDVSSSTPPYAYHILGKCFYSTTRDPNRTGQRVPNQGPTIRMAVQRVKS